jgi:amidophosphoribosyltransferase
MCGFIGIYGPDGVDVAGEIYEGLLAVQHRGQDAAGIITFTDSFHLKKGLGFVLEVFDEKNMSRLQGNLGVGHVRYPTIGGNRGEDAQPFHLTYPIGIAMAHNGNVSNYAELVQGFFSGNRTRLNSSCDLEVILFVFARALNERLRSREATEILADDIFHAVREVFDLVKGAYSVVATLPDVGMVVFRDPFGIKPIIFGEKTTAEGGWFACASESVVLDVNGYKKTIDVGPGEAIFVDSERQVHKAKLADKPHRPCIFEWVYFARPDSMLDDISVYKTRGRFGRALARQWKQEGAPMPNSVIPIPDSSRDAALGMATELGLPYREGLVKNRYIGRTFIMPNQKSRRSSVRRKLNPIRIEFEGRDVLLVDDSIVRGNTSKRIVQMVREAGARKVYLASTSPPLVAPCPYGIDMASKTEFIATNRTNEEIAEELGVDHLIYLDREAMNEAAREGNPEIENFCNACFNGEYPTGDITAERLKAIAGDRCLNRGELRESDKAVKA